MRTIVINKAGGYEQLVLEQRSLGGPGPGEVRIDVEAMGVNYADCVVRMGLYASAKKYVGWPITPGFEVAGKVTAVGEDVEGHAVGSDVVAVTRFGGYATEVVLPAHQVFARPQAFSAVQAAAFPSVFLTAYYALFELAHPKVGQRMLVHSAAGGVGGALLQLARVAGCQAVGVVGAPHKVETATSLGAQLVIDKSSEDLWEAARRQSPAGYHLVFDANGASTLEQSYAHLAETGKLVVYGFHSMLPRGRGTPSWLKLAVDYFKTPRFDPLEMTGANKSVLAFNLSYLFGHRELLAECMGKLLLWVEEGKLQAPPTQTYPLAKVADAHRDLESGATVGKLVLVP